MRQSGAFVAGSDCQGSWTVCGKILRKVGAEISDHLIHGISVEHQECRVVPNTVQTPLNTFLTDVVICKFSHKSFHCRLLGFDGLLNFCSGSSLVNNCSGGGNNVGTFQQSQTVNRL